MTINSDLITNNIGTITVSNSFKITGSIINHQEAAKEISFTPNVKLRIQCGLQGKFVFTTNNNQEEYEDINGPLTVEVTEDGVINLLPYIEEDDSDSEANIADQALEHNSEGSLLTSSEDSSLLGDIGSEEEDFSAWG